MLLLIGALAQGYQWVSCRDCGLGRRMFGMTEVFDKSSSQPTMVHG